MLKASAAASLLLFAGLSLRAPAEESEITVEEDRMSMYDIGALKAGEWVESEMVSKWEGMDETKTKMRMACVGVDGDKVWIEEAAGDFVTLYCISKATRKVTEAWEGGSGEVGTRLKVVPTPAPPDVNETPKRKETGKVTRETLSINGKVLECERVERNSTVTIDGKESAFRMVTWSCEQLPFRRRLDEEARKRALKDIEWDGTPSGTGAVVKSMNEAADGTTSLTVTGWGTDARPTLKTK